jgi:hypothetical protein
MFFFGKKNQKTFVRLIGAGDAGGMRIVVGALMVMMGSAGAQERISLSSEWGTVTAVLADNAAGQALARMLPVTIEMRDHLRQEKTGYLPAPLPEIERQRAFAKGTLGIWSANHFVIYYRDGQVPAPGIMIVGQVSGDVGIFDRPGTVTVRVETAK